MVHKSFDYEIHILICFEIHLENWLTKSSILLV